MAKNSGQPARNLFPSHGAGKGDKDRSNPDKYREGIESINFPNSDEGFERVNAAKKVKHYGPRATKADGKGPSIVIN